MPLLMRRSTQLALPTAMEQASPAAAWTDPEQSEEFGTRAARLPGHLPPRGLLRECANPGCSSGWLQIWRSRSVPIFERGWNCSLECTAARLQAAVSRELDGRGSSATVHRHRVPLGLLMLEQGWITQAQLRGALEGQRANRAGRIGHWLIAKEGVSEHLVTRALGLQWSCPVLPLEYHDPEGLSPVIPRLFVDAFGAVPLRVAAGRLIYLGFEDRLDPALSLAVERMSGLRVESGLVQGSQFRPAHARMLEAKFPPVELLEATSEPALVRALAKAVERAKPVESRLVRVHDCLWLRMWSRPQCGPIAEAACVRDMICTVSGQFMNGPQ
ncbi:MAG TPA: hypothetical protein VGL22_01290 [Terracidiphilus sp.]|jgi:hypothetical protein